MKIRLTKAHGAYKAGQVIDLPERQAQSLIAWEYAVEERNAQQDLIETASVEPVAESADLTPRRRRK